MKILITGICGFVGSTLAEKLIQNDFEIVGIDNFSRLGSADNIDKLSSKGIQVIHGDVRNASDLEGIGKIDWIIDCAANASVLAGLNSSSRQLMENNLYGTINLLEICKQYQAGFTLISTSRVYSTNALLDIPIKIGTNRFDFDNEIEKEIYGLSYRGISELFSTTPPLSLYGTSKLASEHIAIEYSEAFNFPVYLNRCGVMAGKGQFGKADQGIVGFWINSWKNKQPLKYIGFNGSGKQVRDCLHPQDLVPVLVKQIENNDPSKAKICNFSGGIDNTFSLLELSTWCIEKIGKNQVVPANDSRSYDAPWIVLDSSQAKEVWNWEPKTNLGEIFAEIVDL